MSSRVSSRIRSSIALAVIASTCAVMAPAAVSPAGASIECNISTPSAEYGSEVAASARHAQIWRLYQAYFLRQPDAEGLDYWLDVSSELTHVEVSQYFELSREFTNRYGTLSDSEFLELIYANVLCRNPDGEGFEYWLNFLTTGQLSRAYMLVYFAESAEYIDFTKTSWSYFDDPNTAKMSSHGYELMSIPGGIAVQVNLDEVEFKASDSRCAVASINGNWFINPSTQNPNPIGLAVIDGVELDWVAPNGVEDRGVLGVRHRPYGPYPQEVFIGTHLNSNLHDFHNGQVLENWYGFWPDPNAGKGEWDSGEVWGPSPSRIASEYEWAAAGIPLITNGQVWSGLSAVAGTYTHKTGGHSFVAHDKQGNLYFGSVAGKSSTDLVNWAQSAGMEDLIKFDGGGSVELNVGGGAVIGGTSRDVPLWLGIGC